MNKALPKIKETALELKEMLNQERHGKRQNRLQVLFLIASKQATSRTQIAALLGKSRNTISNWLSLYEQSGLDKFLEIYKPAGAATKISDAALADIKAVLASEKGSRTYKELHQMVVKKHSIDIHYSNVHHLVRYKLGAKAKVPRPANPKKTRAEVAEFRETIEEKLKEMIVRHKGLNQKVRLWVQDETRVGLMPIHRRRITDKGRRPLISSEIKREYEYLYGLIEPLTGKDFMLELPNLAADLMGVFLGKFVKQDTESLHIILLDNASAHRGGKVTSGGQYRLYLFSAECAGIKPDGAVLERVEGLALGL